MTTLEHSLSAAGGLWLAEYREFRRARLGREKLQESIGTGNVTATEEQVNVRHILLTWNPGPYNDEQWSPDAWEREMVQGTSEGRTIEGRWSVGNRVQGIEPGDRAYLLRQGGHGRGVVAIGDITSEPFSDASWRGDGRTSQYVHVTWVEAVPLDQRIDIERLKSEIPRFKWDNVYSSGRDLAEHGIALDRIWFEQAMEAAALPPVVQGAGFGSAQLNREVERAAIRYVTDAYESEGYEVSSVETARCGWDLTATRDDEELHLEVKGIAGTLVRFFLTANEYRTAQADPDWMLIAITDALGEPIWNELDGPLVASHAEAALFQVRVPDEVFIR